MADKMTEIILNAGKENGLEIWRIEKFELVPVPRNSYGEFFAGDSYVILYTYEEENKESGELEKKQNIHWWIGEDSSQDEYGAAAIIAVMMDDANDGLPVQCRETMQFESKLFQSYFTSPLSEELKTKNITYKLGGVESGFNHVEVNADDSRRLLRVKGRANQVYCVEVPFAWSSVTEDDVYIFEIGAMLYRWKGPKGNMFEWNQSNQICNSIINDEQAGRGDMESLQADDKWPRELLEVLPDPPKEFPNSGISDKDADAIKAGEQNVDLPDPTLYRISNESGELETTKIQQGLELSRDLLDSNDCFVLDCGNKINGGEIYIWKGKDSNLEEKKQCMKTAINFVKREGYGNSCSIMVFIENNESEFFTQHFDWKE